MYIRAVLVLTLLGFSLAGAPQTAGPPEPPTPRLKKAWETAAVLKQPESVVFDAKRGVLYVSNLHGRATEKNGRGFLSKVSPDGKVVALNWIRGLNAPKGLAIHGDTLYVADIDTLVAVDLTQGRITKRYPAARARFFNDVAVDAQGNVYVSDTATHAVYRLAKGRFERWLGPGQFESPNGLLAEAGRLLVAARPAGSGASGRSVPRHLITVRYRDKRLGRLGSGTPIAFIDGVAADGHGRYFVTDWFDGRLLLVRKSGEAVLLKRLPAGAADLTFLRARKLLVVPLMNTNKLIAFTVQ
jgi:sugar lactone lactonase YvrE